MSFRRKSDAACERRHAAWLDQHRVRLERIGLPLCVWEDADRWEDFVHNGELHWHEDGTRFHVAQLSEGAQRQLLSLLEHGLAPGQALPPLAGWLRVRLGAVVDDG